MNESGGGVGTNSGSVLGVVGVLVDESGGGVGTNSGSVLGVVGVLVGSGPCVVGPVVDPDCPRLTAS